MSDHPELSVSAPAAGFTLSPEQSAIAMHVDQGHGNILVVARAGTGKTFLIRQCLPLMRGPVAICAFNSKIVKEVAAKVAADGNKADIATFHSFGWRAIRSAFPRAKLEGVGPGKAGVFKFDAIAEKLEIASGMHGFVKKAMSLAMQSGFGVFFPLNDKQRWLDLVAKHDIDGEISEDNVALKLHGMKKLVEMGLQAAAKAVKLSIQMGHEIVSFDDMLYLPLVLNIPFPQFRWVLVDEAQDTNAVRREMARRMVMPGGRMMWVGDDRQGIYGFTGADNDALQTIKEAFSCTQFPMTVTRRCSKMVVALARRLVPDFAAHDDNGEGEVLVIKEDAFVGLTFVPGDDAVICRNTAPLVKAAYSLIAVGVPAHVEGKDIGRGLLAIIDKCKGARSSSDLIEKLDAYFLRQSEKLFAKGKDETVATLSDAIETIKVIMRTIPAGAGVEVLRQDIATLFSDTPDGKRPATVTFMTAHRSKGLEFRRVFGWGVGAYFPSRFARQPWQLQQEANLEYVLYTRAIETYVDVVVEGV